MTDDEIRRRIQALVVVDRQHITAMKGLIAKQKDSITSARNLIDVALNELGHKSIERIDLTTDGDHDVPIKNVADWLSYDLAGHEAVWQLIQSGLLMPCDTNTSVPFGVQLTVRSGGGGRSGFLTFDFHASLPSRVVRSNCSDQNVILADGDLYLQHLGLGDFSDDVTDAIAEGVRCLKNELYMAAVVMLGRASELAWIEMGLAISKTFNLTSTAKVLNNPSDSYVKKLRAINGDLDMKHKLDLKVLLDKAGSSIEDVRVAYQWADLLRDSRNVVHRVGNVNQDHTHEKVISLFLTAVPHFRLVHRLLHAAR